jgi:single-stranded-DNA-specific exonuclease
MAHWIDPQPIEIPSAIERVVPATNGWETLIAEMLVRRGIVDQEAALGFLDPAHYTPAAPWELPGIAQTVERLASAIVQKERIAIWGDFDVDGQTATALYLQALRDWGANVRFVIPTRRQSHGVHPLGVQRLIDEGTRVILTADTGVAAHQAIALARGQGVDVLVTDHHDLPPVLPEALAVVNPKLLAPDHPLYELPGVGVAYQVVRALRDTVGRSRAGGSSARGPGIERTLDLVALGIVADVATVRADVRYLLQRGLDVLRYTDRTGLQAMMSLAGLEPAFLTEEDIGFSLAPRLNAISRVEQDPDTEMTTASAVELLTTSDLTRARTLATALEALNARRRWLTQQTAEAALSQLERERWLLEGPAIVVAGANWDPGIVGIVAGRLAERFHKPAIVLSAPPDEMARGSARSIEGIDIHAAIAAHKELLYRCGGHPMAAGLSIDGDRLDEFRRALWRTLEQTAPPPAEPRVQIDAVLTLDQVSVELVRAVNALAPFGPGNEAPILAVRDLTLASSAVIGRTREHRRLVVRDREGREQTVLWWRSTDQPAPEGTFDLAFTVGIHRFRGEEIVQLTWVDARVTSLPAVQAGPRLTIAVRDLRPQASSLANSLAASHAILAAAGLQSAADLLVWGEGTRAPAGVPLSDRHALKESETLVLWTAPPGPEELYAALASVSPRLVVLVGIDPGLDTPRAFLQRLAGLVKYALREYGGQTRLSELAAAMAHDTSTVRLGLEWMACKGQVDVVCEGDRVELKPAFDRIVDETAQEHVVRGRLLAQLEEAAAYREYFISADAGRLIHSGLNA